jgi:hypothetical protein
MIFKDLQRLVQPHFNAEQNELFVRLKDKPFWIWSTHEHKLQLAATNGNYCFNHIIRLLTASENKFDEEVKGGRRRGEERRGEETRGEELA